ncbi:hypothetical protein FB451DRAFT_75287 [Mycena latifolia]|nr:hypothetical protein FB451DRAFT_75287 [Mycena latifolia]
MGPRGPQLRFVFLGYPGGAWARRCRTAALVEDECHSTMRIVSPLESLLLRLETGLIFKLDSPIEKLTRTYFGLVVGVLYMAVAISLGVTEMDNTWTRLHVEPVPETETNLGIRYTIRVKGGPWRSLKRCWLSHATRLLGPWIAADNHLLDDLFLITGAVLEVHLQFPEQSAPRDSPTSLPYLFLSSPRIEFDVEGSISVIIPPRDQRYYWSFDPTGDEQLGEELAARIPLPEVEFELLARGSSWTADQYTLLRDFEKAKENASAVCNRPYYPQSDLL